MYFDNLLLNTFGGGSFGKKIMEKFQPTSGRVRGQQLRPPEAPVRPEETEGQHL